MFSVSRSLSLGLALITAASLWGQPAKAQSINDEQAAILAGLNACFIGEERGGFGQEALRLGFGRAPQATGDLYVAKVNNSTIFVGADYGAGADGRPEPACRITVLKPQIDEQYTPRGPVLPEASAFIDYLVQRTARLGEGYSLVYRRQPHPTRSGKMRTLLRSDMGARVRLLYIEEGPNDVELLYAHGARAVMMNPQITDIGTDPRGRQNMQAYVNDVWEIAFCDLNPHACLTRAQMEEMERQARVEANRRDPIPIPFSGIGGRSGDNRTNEQRLRSEAAQQERMRCERWRQEGRSLQCH